jgi:hypothetical protein
MQVVSEITQSAHGVFDQQRRFPQFTIQVPQLA